MLREYRQLFLTKGIDVSYDKVVLSKEEKLDFKSTKAIKNEANEFVKEQNDVSSGLEEQQKD